MTLTITYRKGTENQNADALSRQFEHVGIHSAATSVSCQFIEDVKLQQHYDSIINFVSCMRPSHIVLCLLALMHGHNVH